MLKKYRPTIRKWKLLGGLGIFLWNLFLIFLWEITGIFNGIATTTLVWFMSSSSFCALGLLTSSLMSLKFNDEPDPFFVKVKD